MVGKYLKSGLASAGNVANNLTLLRIACVPLLLIIFPFDHKVTDIISALLFVLAALTDFFDGFFARKFNTTSRLGEILDPIADKLLAVTMLLALCAVSRMPVLIGGLLVCREIIITGLRSVAAEQGSQIAVGQLGKWKTVAMWVTVFCLIINDFSEGLSLRYIGLGAMWVTLVLSYWSGWSYVQCLQNLPPIKRNKKRPANAEQE